MARSKASRRSRQTPADWIHQVNSLAKQIQRIFFIKYMYSINTSFQKYNINSEKGTCVNIRLKEI